MLRNSKQTGRPIKVLLIGWGAIARRLHELLTTSPEPAPGISIVGVIMRGGATPRPDIPGDMPQISNVAGLAGLDADIVLEVAGHAALAEWGEAVIGMGCDLVVTSSGALCDEALLSELCGRAAEVGRQVVVPSGAIGGMDALRAASFLRLDSVEHTIVKPPAAWRDTPAQTLLDLSEMTKAQTFFRGSAREAAHLFPANANVAATISLAGAGLDRTRTNLVADPKAATNQHHIRAEGAFGSLTIRIESNPLRDNPKSSELTALSLLALLQRRSATLVC